MKKGCPKSKRTVVQHFVMISFLISCFLFLSACSGCRSKEDEPVRVNSGELMLKSPSELSKDMTSAARQPNVQVINIGPSKDLGPVPSGGGVNVPSDVSMDHALTSRLKDKLNQAFSSRGVTPPDIDIYTGSMSLESFSKFYEDKGFKIQRTSVPASQVVAPLLEEKPELAGRINLANYAGITINQVIVEGANISAADKYIDPETYQVVYRTFVTVTKGK